MFNNDLRYLCPKEAYIECNAKVKRIAVVESKIVINNCERSSRGCFWWLQNSLTQSFYQRCSIILCKSRNATPNWWTVAKSKSSEDRHKVGRRTSLWTASGYGSLEVVHAGYGLRWFSTRSVPVSFGVILGFGEPQADRPAWFDVVKVNHNCSHWHD